MNEYSIEILYKLFYKIISLNISPVVSSCSCWYSSICTI